MQRYACLANRPYNPARSVLRGRCFSLAYNSSPLTIHVREGGSMNVRFFSQVILTTAVAAAMTTSALGQAIGLNFTGGNNAGAPTPLLPSDVAGAAYQQANWNNADGISGTLTGLVNQAGVATS